MKVLFLDIDGVLIPNAWLRDARRESIFAPAAVGLLNQILSATEAKIVVSSSWRIQHGIEGLRQLFTNEGVKGDLIGITPVLKRCRGEEIQSWLAEHHDVQDFVIVDDVDDMEHLSNRLVLIDSDLGLSTKDLELIVQRVS